jgi:hypothetical protein
MQDRHRAMIRVDCRKDWHSDGMITTEQYWCRAIFEAGGDGTLNHRIIIWSIFSESEITQIFKREIKARLHPVFARQIAAITPQRLADSGRSGSGTAFKRAVTISWQANQVKKGKHQLMIARLTQNVTRKKDPPGETGLWMFETVRDYALNGELRGGDASIPPRTQIKDRRLLPILSSSLR